MGIGKHGMSLGEARSAADGLEISPSKTQASSHIATGGKKKATGKKSAAGSKQTSSSKGGTY